MKLDKCNTMGDIFRKIFLNIIRRMSTVHDVFILFHCKKVINITVILIAFNRYLISNKLLATPNERCVPLWRDLLQKLNLLP